MFIVTDTLERRHRKIRSFVSQEPVIAILLAAVDFEWTVRRAILALGTNSNRYIRDRVLNRCHGADEYKRAWNGEVASRLGRGLPDVIRDWEFLKKEAFTLRHQVVHGLKGMPSSKKTLDRVESFLGASKSLSDFASLHGVSLFGKRLPVRRKSRAV